MPKMIKYAVVGGKSLDKVACEICGQTYGSVEEARKCEQGHYKSMLKGTLESITMEEWSKIVDTLIEANVR